MAAMDAAMSLASDIASKSPVAVFGTKHNLIYSRDHSVADGLEYAVSAEGVTMNIVYNRYFGMNNVMTDEKVNHFIFTNGS